MKLSFKDLEQKLRQNNIKPSYQRLKVLEYLLDHSTHPPVDKIYDDLQQEMPTLSKTTVYNTLRVLVEADLVKAISIQDHECCYDANIKSHGHFMCLSCDNIIDFSIDISDCTNGLQGYKIEDKDVYFKGTCPTCLKDSKNSSLT